MLPRHGLIALLATLAITLVSGDADFDSVRTHLKKDRSGRKGDPKSKYFHESTFNAHYDGRFASHTLGTEIRHVALARLMQSYLVSMESLGITTWIMHGTLLGWWWNAKIFPWDSDVDVQVTMGGMEYLAQFYNMTIHSFAFTKERDEIYTLGWERGSQEFGETYGSTVGDRVSHIFSALVEKEGDEYGKRKDGVATSEDAPLEEETTHRYLLEINPNYVNSSWLDRTNAIDARWIDTDTGLFIDITTLRVNTTAVAEGHPGSMMCKDRHHYMYDEIFPLRDSIFEGVAVKVPFAYSPLLTEEYGPHSLTDTVVQGFRWEENEGAWKIVQGPKENPGQVVRVRGRPGGFFKVSSE